MTDRKLVTRILSMDPKDLVLLEKNARYMTAAQYERLVNNVKRDGCLTSLPLVYRDGDAFIVLSGNHRTKAAADAGLKTIDVLEICTPLTPEERTAIQLSHNAITGQDELNTLQDLYRSLGLEERLYSGLDDSVLDMDPLKLPTLGSLSPEYVQVLLFFLPEDAAIVSEVLDRIAKQPKPLYHFADLATWDEFFNSVVATKEGANVLNSAAALRAMARLAAERLDQLAAESEA